MDNNDWTLFGYTIKKSKEKEKENIASVVPPTDGENSGYVSASGAHFGSYVDLNNDKSNNHIEQINKYRGIATHADVDAAIEDIVNEAISSGDNGSSVNLVLDNIELSDNIKNTLTEEFKNIVKMLKFNEIGHDIFRRWYVDGRLFHHLLVDKDNIKLGIQDIRFIDSLKIEKVKEVKYKTDEKTNVKVVDHVNEYFMYREKPKQSSLSAVKLSKDSVNYITSGLLDESQKKVISHLQKALKPANQLRMMEDALIIYRLARAPERRVFYIDVGNMPRGKAEEYMKSIMSRYRNKLVYDASTGEAKDSRKHMSMLEDFWLPRKEGGRGTEISTLPGGDNLGQIEDILFFQKKLYKSLNVPVNRLEQENAFNIGRSTEITRDEVKFQKFIDRLRMRFSHLFIDILKQQAIIKNIITEEEWDANVAYSLKIDFVRDTHFSELKEAEIVRERLQTLDMVENHIGVFYSKEYVWREILRLNDEEIEKMKKEISDEMSSEEQLPQSEE